jgi:hypothetical protein
LVKSQSQQQQSEEKYSIANEEINEDLILRSWKGVEQQVQHVREFNASQNVPNPDAYIGYHYDGIVEPISVKQKRRWLDKTRHRKSGKYITVSSLVESGRISDVEKEMFGEWKYPRIELLSMTRVKTRDNKEYLMRGMRAIGLSEIGGTISLPLYDCDFTRKVPITPTTATLPDGTDTKILQIGTGEFTYETSPKIYLTPFTRQNVLAALEKYPPSEENELQGKISYILMKEGASNPTQVLDLDTWMNEDFDSIWQRQHTPAPTISIDSKTLGNYIKMDRESRQEHKQYS